MTSDKAARVEAARREAAERAQRAVSSLALCLARSEVMRVHHNLLIEEIDARSVKPTMASDSPTMHRLFTYTVYWFAGLCAVIERYQELSRKGTIPAEPTLDAQLTEDHLSLVKPFRNAVTHCSDYDDARVVRLLESVHTLPDWAERVALSFKDYIEANGYTPAAG